MRSTRRLTLLIVILAAARASTAAAQSIPPGGGRSLGGYGGAMTGSGMGGGATGIPYAGRFGGFMPYRMGVGVDPGGLSFQPRAAAMPNAVRTPFRLPTMTGGMGAGMGAGTRLMPPAPMSGTGGRGMGMGVMPPSLGYPFRQPPSLLSPASSAPGMSM